MALRDSLTNSTSPPKGNLLQRGEGEGSKAFLYLISMYSWFPWRWGIYDDASIKLALAVAKWHSLIRIFVQKVDFCKELKMINAPLCMIQFIGEGFIIFHSRK